MRRLGVIIAFMERIIDEICLMLLCCVFAGIMGDLAYEVLGFLASIILVCGWEYAQQSLNGTHGKVARICLICAFCAAALFACIYPFLPMVIYIGLHERPLWVRVLFVVPLLVFAVTSGFADPAFLTSLVGCAVGALLAIRDVRQASERSGLRFAFDDAREKNLEMRACMSREMRANDHAEDANARTGTCDRMHDVLDRLSKRELAIAKLVAEGKDNREIASELFLSEGTVRNHVSSILSKMELANRTQIAITMMQNL